MINEQEVIRQYLEGISLKEITKNNNINKSTIYDILKRNEIHKRRNSKIPEEEIIKLYSEGLTDSAKISRILKCDDSGVYYHIKKLGLKSIPINNRLDVNQSFFKNIDTEDKAYCLGLMYSDGCVYIDKKNQYFIKLQMCDLDIIEKFKKALDYTGKIHKTIREKKKIIYQLHISSKDLCKDLIEKGCVPRKSLILKFPENVIPKHLMGHFIRGIFDGDGSISKSKNNKWNVSICGTKDLILGIQKHLNFKSQIYKCTNKELYYLGLTSENSRLEFLKYIYKYSTIYMDRKYILYKEFINHA